MNYFSLQEVHPLQFYNVLINKVCLQTEEDVLPDLFWEPSLSIRNARLKRYVVDIDDQEEFESQK